MLSGEKDQDIQNVIAARYMKSDMRASEIDHDEWSKAQAVHVTRYWSGATAPPERHFEARTLWTDYALIVRFDCQQHEPLIVNEAPQVEHKAMGLWERDVCEIFVAPDREEPERYLEFEAAPNGEWLDLAIRQLSDKRETDWEFHSGMTTATRLLENFIQISIRVPWKAFGRVPQMGERWRANFLRCIGAGETRGYLAWQPTYTPEPDFHVPQVFGFLRFVK